jgi:hypothetical protein
LPMMAFWTTLDSRNKTTKSNMLRVARSRLPASRNKIRIVAYTKTVRRIFSRIGIWTANIECHTEQPLILPAGPGVIVPAEPGHGIRLYLQSAWSNLRGQSARSRGRPAVGLVTGGGQRLLDVAVERDDLVQADELGYAGGG